MVVVLTETQETNTSAAPGASLWLAKDELAQATGWSLESQGLCRGDVCVPLPAGREAEFATDEAVNVSAFWALMDKPLACSDSGDVWFLGEAADDRNAELLSLEAPDFELPDSRGRLRRLSDFRRKRVLLITWASW